MASKKAKSSSKKPAATKAKSKKPSDKKSSKKISASAKKGTTIAKAASKAPAKPTVQSAKKSDAAVKAQAPAAKSPGWMKKIVGGIEAVARAVEERFSSKPQDIVAAVMMDHEGLREFIGILKDPHKDMGERRRAYELFSALLKSHTIAEEKVVYASIAQIADPDLQTKVAEGYVEHQVSDDVMVRMEAAKDAKTWGAHANVLAELVEHHLKEEEDDMLPRVRRETSTDMNTQMIINYLQLRQETQKKVTKKNEGVLESLN